MFCTKCGTKIEEENIKFCPKCGEPVKQPKKENAPKKKSGKKAIFILIVLIIASLAAGGGLYVYRMKESKSVSKKETEKKKDTKKKETKEKKKDEKSDEYAPGSNIDDAVLLPLGTKVFSSVNREGALWYSFSTDEEVGATYCVTIVNRIEDSQDIYANLLDEDGNLYESGFARADGVPQTLMTDELQPNTMYYVKMESRFPTEENEYSIVVKKQNNETTSYKTSGDISLTGGTANAIQENEKVSPGTNQSEALALPLDTKVTGSTTEVKNFWFSFTTDENVDTQYFVTVVNKTVQSQYIRVVLYDEYGITLESGLAHNDGEPLSLSSQELEPDTTYYVQVYVDGIDLETEYSLIIKSTKTEKEEASLVFEVPFEINETQVQFVMESAEFLDKNQAKSAVKPVADAINNAPGHAILIAGTTATDGKQESCVKLSLKRAEAVKGLLMDAYHVSESQIKVVGLGYEADPFERGQDRDPNGNFVESEARKNRRVVILDAEDPIAQELLSK